MNAARAVVVPMTPLLLPGLTGLVDPVADLRAEAEYAVRELVAAHERVVALCPVGVEGAPAYHLGGESAPLSVLVARHLLGTTEVEIVEVGGPLDRPLPSVGLLVLGDGSARRSETGPGGLDPRAAAFDDDLCAALGKGDGRALAALDQELATELLVTGRHTFAALGDALPEAAGEVRWRGEPFGVTYLVACWR